MFEEMSFSFGCSAVSWETGDGKHLWGRNFDFDRFAAGSQVTYVPREAKICLNTEGKGAYEAAEYAAVGTGLLLEGAVPVLYEGINEKGLMGGQLYYREFASFSEENAQGKQSLQPPFLVIYLLSQCASTDEAAEKIREISLSSVPLLGSEAPIHWCFSDRTGEMIIIEPDRDGVKIYRNTMGVMTNSPSYPWHRLNLLNYSQIRDLDYGELSINHDRIRQCFSGSGALGMPGDWSSPSRFVRLSFLKKYGVKGRNEEEGIAFLFRLLGSAAFPYGIVQVPVKENLTEYDKEVSPYDYTIYTCGMCGESLRYYWMTYENSQVQYVELDKLLGNKEFRQFKLRREPDFKCVTEFMSPQTILPDESIY